MKIAILQSNYLPWTGVFELINSVDKFVFYDNVQFTKQDWITKRMVLIVTIQSNHIRHRMGRRDPGTCT